MKIILIVEGSYPYIFGGVASWIQMLITGMPEHEFEVIAISSSREEASQWRYPQPDNLTRVHDVYLMDYLALSEGRGPRLSPAEAQACLDWFAFAGHADLEKALPMLADPKRLGNPLTYLASPAFWPWLMERYRQETPYGSFHAYVQSWHAMVVPALSLLQQDYPKGDIYHAVSTGYAGLLAASLRFKHRKPFILTEHGIYAREREQELWQAAWPEAEFKPRWVDYFYHLAQCAYRTADRTVALTSEARAIQLGLGLPSERSVVIPNGVSYERFAQLPRLALDSAARGFVCGAMVRLVPIKDIQTMLHAAALASRQLPELELWIMGPVDEEPTYAEECRALVHELELDSFVRFLGLVEVTEYLPHVDVLLLSSVSEGQPLAILEGMAAAIPWICTDVGGCRELLEGSDSQDTAPAGCLVPPGDPEAMAERLVQLCRAPETRTAMGQAGRERVERKYRLSQVTEAYRKLYDEVVSGWPG
ncbi:GT4 family glycosyltransferase PelF [Paenibacillus cremeus]|uniref:DUF3492 domain-containing protein n=1 Tax=Paenibacillus cremeus TaxID=2163881 RepID=A0A559KIK2_9BACL|nr:GT4 family glycosyltransferase PelF [Paenibacillus cremeus]TVY11967.1 DUF3492 domain-containing protein [Paenibacillus cremeus]